MMKRLAAALLFGSLAFGSPALAQSRNLTLALAGSVTSLDPHFHNLIPNNNIAEHIFDKLAGFDATGKLQPRLATAWRQVDATTWEFKLRPGVTFSDGTPLTAADVVFSLTRIPTVPNSPGPFTPYIRGVTAEAVDDTTVRMRTPAPNSLLPYDLSTIFIVSRKAAEGASTEDFNSGKAAIGTGPFKFSAFARGESVTLERNDRYWGEKPAWDRATFRMIPKAPSRIAGLLAGDLDVVEAVPTSDVENLKREQRFQVASAPSTRLIYVFFDQERDESPLVSGPNGEKLTNNPFKDVRVRRAMSLAVDREAIRTRLMGGFSVPAGQLVPEGTSGHVKGLAADKADPDAAKKLLAEAGYPDGFTLTLHGSNDRYVNDGQILQALAAMWRRIGVRTNVEVMPFASMGTQVRSRAVSAYMVGFAAVTGDATAQLRTLVMTFNQQRGTGVLNYARFSDPKIDAAIDRAFAAANEEDRLAAVEEATRSAMSQHVLLPIHFQVTTWGARAGLNFTARTDEYTMAHEIRPRP